MTSRSITAAFVAAAFAALVPCTFAQCAADKKMDKPAMAHPKPPAEMANLKFFDGSWSCAGEGVMEPGGPTMKMDSSVQSTTGLGGFWQTGTVKGSPMGGMPPFEGMFHMTWDPAAKQYLMLWVDNMGGRSESRSPGWSGDTLVFTGDGQMGDQKMGMRDTFTRKADGSMSHVGDMQVNGKWVKMMDETCRKAAR
jgi:uncharacterized protein DUF1579